MSSSHLLPCVDYILRAFLGYCPMQAVAFKIVSRLLHPILRDSLCNEQLLAGRENRLGIGFDIEGDIMNLVCWTHHRSHEQHLQEPWVPESYAGAAKAWLQR